jgi:hypothetical protein
MNFAEKRKMERFSLNLPALITIIDERGNQQVFNVMSSNICAGGSYFKTDAPLSVGTDVKVELINHG